MWLAGEDNVRCVGLERRSEGLGKTRRRPTRVNLPAAHQFNNRHAREARSMFGAAELAKVPLHRAQCETLASSATSSGG
jgi:hypothetical protein